jgi:hypothetical protein
MMKFSSPSERRSSVSRLLGGLLIAAALVVCRGGLAPAHADREPTLDSTSRFVASAPQQSAAGVLRASAPVVARSSIASSMPMLAVSGQTVHSILRSRVAAAFQDDAGRATDTVGLRGYDAAAPPFGL